MAEQANHSQITPGDLLAGTTADTTNMASKAIAMLGGNPAEVSAQAQSSPTPSECRPVNQPEPSATTTSIIQQAERQATRMGHATVGTEHLLLAMLAAHEADAGHILRRHGVTRTEAKAAISRMLTRRE